MVKRGNKQFVATVISISVLGLVALMITLFIVLRSFLANNPVVATNVELQETENTNSKVELSETMLILVHNITEESVEGFDIKQNISVTKPLSDTTRINDAYGNTIPISEIKKGDIIKVECAEDTAKVFSISRSTDTQSWKKINGITIDQDNKLINIGGTSYKYIVNTMVIDESGKAESLSNIGPYDIVTIQVYDGTIWSVIINDRSGNIALEDLPVSDGTIEIDNSRLINFADVTEPIKVTSGKHKVVIRMTGYEVINKEVNIVPGETYTISLIDAEKAYTLVRVMMHTPIKEYTIQIGEETYKPSDEIRIEEGKYILKITAKGYEPYSRQIMLAGKEMAINVRLQKIEETPPPSSATPEGNVTNNSNRTVTFNTEPSGAKVYVDGTLSGQTPYTATLTPGNHTILFEKDGYAIYSTSVLIDATNDQSNFLYVLTKLE